MVKETANTPSARAHLNFASTVAEIFAFLEKMGFSVIEISPTLVRYQKNDLEVNIYHGRQSYELGFEVCRKGAVYSINQILALTAFHAADSCYSFAPTTQKGVTRGLARLAELVRAYAGPAVRGDSMFFDALDKLGSLRKEELALEVLTEQLLPKANDAFREKRYREAVKLYEKITARLSPTELKKLAFAKKRSM